MSQHDVASAVVTLTGTVFEASPTLGEFLECAPDAVRGTHLAELLELERGPFMAWLHSVIVEDPERVESVFDAPSGKLALAGRRASQSAKRTVPLYEVRIAPLDEPLPLEDLEHNPLRDRLTGLVSGLLLKDRLEQALAGCQRTGELIAVCYIDLDNFQGGHQTYGRGASNRG
ncbi:MAG: diguanylate cyclase domain-containing protein, partial [Solirubrobacteraceae bacterium]